MKRQITCIVCPRGCALTVETSGTEITVTGNTCPKGEKHAIAECMNPVRVITSTVRVRNRKDTMVSVKTTAPVPRGKMFAVMKLIRAVHADAPIAVGDVILPHVFDTEIIATKAIE